MQHLACCLTCLIGNLFRQCNNLKTHEPKLARAKRLIPEWTVYDQEIAALASKIAAENKLKAQASTSGGGASNSAEAFTDEAGQLEQAREQQKEFVKEGTGSDETPVKVDAEVPKGHVEGEL